MVLPWQVIWGEMLAGSTRRRGELSERFGWSDTFAALEGDFDLHGKASVGRIDDFEAVLVAVSLDQPVARVG
jgi:hypothetical protein